MENWRSTAPSFLGQNHCEGPVGCPTNVGTEDSGRSWRALDQRIPPFHQIAQKGKRKKKRTTKRLCLGDRSVSLCSCSHPLLLSFHLFHWCLWDSQQWEPLPLIISFPYRELFLSRSLSHVSWFVPLLSCGSYLHWLLVLTVCFIWELKIWCSWYRPLTERRYRVGPFNMHTH